MALEKQITIRLSENDYNRLKYEAQIRRVQLRQYARSLLLRGSAENYISEAIDNINSVVDTMNRPQPDSKNNQQIDMLNSLNEISKTLQEIKQSQEESAIFNGVLIETLYIARWLINTTDSKAYKKVRQDSEAALNKIKEEAKRVGN